MLVLVDDANNLAGTTILNSKMVRDSNTSVIIFSVDEGAFIAHGMTLNKDDEIECIVTLMHSVA